MAQGQGAAKQGQRPNDASMAQYPGRRTQAGRAAHVADEESREAEGATPLADLMGAPLAAQVPVDLDTHSAVLPYSSGTTGLPKGVMLSHRNLVVNTDQFLGVVKIAPGEITPAFLPFFHIYGLEVLARHIEDSDHNPTRFLIMGRDPDMTRRAEHMMTTFVFNVRNIPAALYKAMGGFATNGVNMTKLESYMVDGSFTATQFYADIEGHPDDPMVQLALEELRYFTSELHILGTYPADAARG